MSTNQLTIDKDTGNKILELIEWSKSIIVNNQETRRTVLESLQEIKSQRKKIVDFFADTKKKAHDTWKSICNQEKGFTDQLDDVEKRVKRAVLAFDQEEEKQRLLKQAQLQAEADERARKERERLLKKADNVKSPEKKEAYLEQAEAVEETVVQVAEPEKVDGVATVKRWKAEVTNKKEFLEAALKDENLMAYVAIDIQALNKLAAATKGAIKYPGTRFFEESTLSVRS